MPDLDILTLRSQITNALSGQIGNYVYGNGSTQPALRIESGTEIVDDSGNPLPAPTRVAGLEVVIEPYTNTSVLLYMGKEGGLEDRYRITLKQHDRTLSVSADFTTLFKSLVRLGQPISAGPLQPRTSALNRIEQQVLFVNYQR
ncbi:MAG: hypothetical protein AAGD09_03580 [Cyanobacteria bacterium P01_F01_bin.56]